MEADSVLSNHDGFSASLHILVGTGRNETVRCDSRTLAAAGALWQRRRHRSRFSRIRFPSGCPLGFRDPDAELYSTARGTANRLVQGRNVGYRMGKHEYSFDPNTAWPRVSRGSAPDF